MLKWKFNRDCKREQTRKKLAVAEQLSVPAHLNQDALPKVVVLDRVGEPAQQRSRNGGREGLHNTPDGGGGGPKPAEVTLREGIRHDGVRG